MLYLIPPWLRREFELQIECKLSFFNVKEPNSSENRSAGFIRRYFLDRAFMPGRVGQAHII